METEIWWETKGGDVELVAGAGQALRRDVHGRAETCLPRLTMVFPHLQKGEISPQTPYRRGIRG